jgi:hypothetical protein
VLPQGCISTDPSDCTQIRGGVFIANQSSTWVPNTANLSTDIYPLHVGTQLGYNDKARFGFDDVTLGWQGAGGPSLKNQTVGGFATKDSFLGLFGLAPKASNFTSFADPIPSYMENLRSQSLIPSTSWAYTAGNEYRKKEPPELCDVLADFNGIGLNNVLGSLVLGGYDESKFIPNGVIWSFNSEDIRDLTVQITSITTDTSNQKLLPEPIPAFLDSGLPYIWLPVEACTLFEDAFNLTWNNASELYLLDDSQHNTLLAQNPNVTFTLGNLTAGVNVNITLPYAAFDLKASAPLVANSTRYFPLKRATNDTQYTLGRTFFQEAYVIADYDRRNFSVAQCNWNPSAQQNIITIRSPSGEGSASNGTAGTSGGSKSSNSVPVGAVAGGVVGGVVAIAGIAALLWFFCIKPRRRRAKATELAAQTGTENDPPAPPPEDPTADKAEMDNQDKDRVHEMEGKKNQWVVETDGQEVQIAELPAREEVAAELTGQRDAVEMMDPRHPVEMDTPANNPRFSWIQTPADKTGESDSPPPRWSWTTSTAGGTTPIEKSREDMMSPTNPAMKPIAEEAPSPQSSEARISPMDVAGSSTNPPRWSWITSPGGATLVDGEDGEKENMKSPVGPEIERAETPRSLPAQLARLPE